MFLSIKAGSGDSGDRSAFGDFWFSPVPYRGGNVTSETALKLTAVLRCVRLLSDSLSTMPFVLYRPRSDGGRTYITDHWLYKLFARRPNDFQNPVQYRKMQQALVETRGNAYSRIIANRSGEVTDLLPIHPDRVTVEKLDDNNWRYRVTNADGSTSILTRGQMFHRKGLSLDGIVGLNPIALARESLATGLAAQAYGARFFQNDGRPGGVLEMPTTFPSDEKRREFRNSWQEQQTGGNQGKTAILEFGMKFSPIALTNVDAQFIESKKFSVIEIARLFGCPPHKLADLEKSAFTNIEQQNLDFINDALNPRAVDEAAEIVYQFVGDDDDLQVEFLFTALLKGDSAARQAFYHEGVLDGWMTRNEARVAEGKNPLPGLDEPMRPLNMTTEAEAADKAANPPPPPIPPKPAPPQPPPTKQKAEARLGALVSAAADRVARKEWEIASRAVRVPIEERHASATVAYRQHAVFVANVLNVDNSSAIAYCMTQLDLLRDQPRIEKEAFIEIARARLERMALDDEGSTKNIEETPA